MVTTNSRLARLPAGHPPSCAPTVGNPGGAGAPVGSPTPPTASTGVSLRDLPAADETRAAPAGGAQLPHQLLRPRNLEGERGSCSLSWRPAGRRTSEAAMPPFHSFNTFTQGLLCAPHWGCRTEKRDKTAAPRGLRFTKMAEMREPSDS